MLFSMSKGKGSSIIIISKKRPLFHRVEAGMTEPVLVMMHTVSFAISLISLFKQVWQVSVVIWTLDDSRAKEMFVYMQPNLPFSLLQTVVCFYHSLSQNTVFALVLKR